ncbi:MAG TPA: hypothetical protein VGK11_02345, partial [Actinomycetota bacterium]
APERFGRCGGMSPMRPRFFATPSEFRALLESHHATAKELLVGFHKKGSGIPSITWPEAVERTPRSRWSARNIERAKELIAQGRMHPAGRKAFEDRTEDRSAIYSYRATGAGEART